MASFGGGRRRKQVVTSEHLNEVLSAEKKIGCKQNSSQSQKMNNSCWLDEVGQMLRNFVLNRKIKKFAKAVDFITANQTLIISFHQLIVERRRRKML